MKRNGGYELGKAYFNNYWQQMFMVEEIHNEGQGNWFVTVQWQDGHYTTHCTVLGKKDREVSLDEFRAALAG